MVEVTAPNGYEKAEKVKFTVEDTGEIQKVHMYDEPVLRTPEMQETPNAPRVCEKISVNRISCDRIYA